MTVCHVAYSQRIGEVVSMLSPLSCGCWYDCGGWDSPCGYSPWWYYDA